MLNVSHVKDKFKRNFLVSIIVLGILHALTLCIEYRFEANLKILSRISLILFFLSAVGYVIFYSWGKIKSWISVEVNPQLMVLTRVIYAILCLFSAYQHITLIESGLEPYNFLLLGWYTPSKLAYLLSFAYVSGLLMLLFGYRIRLAWIIVFISGGFIIPFSLEIFLKNIFNFYAIFISTDLWKGKKTNKGTWSISLMLLSVGVLMFSAGLHKLLDPVWQSGLGFYYSLNIAFFPKKFFWWILDYKWLMIAFNWSTIVAEMIMLPLLIKKKTWAYANLCVLGLGLFLTFGMSGIGVMGGPIVICMFLLFLSLTKIPERFEKYIPQPKLFNLSRNKAETKPRLCHPAIGVILFWYTISCSLDNLYRDFRPLFFNYPIAYYGFKNTSPSYLSEKSLVINSSDFIVRHFLYPLQPHRFWQFNWSLALFDYHHLFDRLFFKVVYIDKNGNEVEHLHYFDDDGSIASNHPLWGNEKFLLTCFRMMDAVRNEPYITKGVLTPHVAKELKSLIYYSLDDNDPNLYTSAIIRIKPMYQPYEYMGNTKPWIDNEWEDFYRWDFTSRQGTVIEKFEPFDHNQLKIDGFENHVIEPVFK